MEGTDEVKGGGQAIGSVTVTRQGLYYHFACRCRLTKETLYRLIMKNDGMEHDLGILTPLDCRFGMNTLISIKKAGTGVPKFYLLPHRQTVFRSISPVSPDEPFSYISRLETAFLVKNNGEKKIGFQKENI